MCLNYGTHKACLVLGSCVTHKNLHLASIQILFFELIIGF